MDQEKPFKTVEVIDARTSQLCKIACMSCIRGHRTTSCGIPVCRSKIFWTVKRPGRPSSSCTCRYVAGVGCKCVVAAKSACPHKSKKGEKRTGECRCDEQGRYCCVVEPDHWTALFALQKPRINFFQSREALEGQQPDGSQAGTPAPSFASASRMGYYPTPETMDGQHSDPSTFSTPAPATPFSPPQHGSISNGSETKDMSTHMPQYNGIQSPPHQSSLTPRFGMMGIGAPQGNNGVVTPDVLSWQGEAPLAPTQYFQSSFQDIPYQQAPHHPTQEQIPTFQPYQESSYQQSPYTPIPPQEERSSCCGGASSPAPLPPAQQMQFAQAAPMNQFAGMMPQYTMPPEPEPLPTNLATTKMTNDYFSYMLPNAICQKCGLNGCTCKNCPPVMQNFATGSWAQCCGRKHARTETPQPQQQPAAKRAPTEADFPRPNFQQPQLFDDFGAQQNSSQPPNGRMRYNNVELNPDFGIPEGTNQMELSDMLLSELDRPTHGCCGGNS